MLIIRIPDISKWNINETLKMNNFLNKYLSLLSTSNITEIQKEFGIILDISYLFYECSSLKKL